MKALLKVKPNCPREFFARILELQLPTYFRYTKNNHNSRSGLRVLQCGWLNLAEIVARMKRKGNNCFVGRSPIFAGFGIQLETCRSTSCPNRKLKTLETYTNILCKPCSPISVEYFSTSWGTGASNTAKTSNFPETCSSTTLGPIHTKLRN